MKILETERLILREVEVSNGEFMLDLKSVLLVLCVSLVFSACGLVSSQEMNSGNRNAVDAGKPEVNQNSSVADAPTDRYEILKADTEKLNAEPLPPGSKFRAVKPLSREQIREALIRSDLIGESKDGKVGGGKVIHFSHTCDLFVDDRPFHVIYAPIVIQLASSARRSNRVLIYDDAMRLTQNLTAKDAPLFCDGNRLFFNDNETSFFYGDPEKEVRGNVLVFSRDAKDIEGRTADLNFYRFSDLIH